MTSKTPPSQKRAVSRYLKTDRGKAALRRYKKSAKGKRSSAKYEETRKDDLDRREKRREYNRLYRARKKAEQLEQVEIAPPLSEDQKRERRRAYQREWQRRKREEAKRASNG